MFKLVLNLCMCNRKATSNNPVMDNTITSQAVSSSYFGTLYVPSNAIFSPSGKRTPPVNEHLPLVVRLREVRL